jgi:hypothetical protein
MTEPDDQPQPDLDPQDPEVELDDEPGQEPDADDEHYPGEPYPGDEAAQDTNTAGWEDPGPDPQGVTDG